MKNSFKKQSATLRILSIRTFVSLSALSVLVACSSGGSAYTPSKVEAGASQLVVYRPSSLAYILRTPNIESNGLSLCDLPNGSFFTKSVKPQQETISASLWDMPGTSKVTFSAKPNTTHFIRVSLDGGKVSSVMVGGFVGNVVAEGISSQAGPFNIDLVDQETATKELAGLKEACK